VEGSALGGNFALVLKLLAQGAMPGYAARGAAAAGETALTFHLISKYGANPIFAMQGADYVGNVPLMKLLTTAYPDFKHDHTTKYIPGGILDLDKNDYDLQELATGAALAGQYYLTIDCFQTSTGGYLYMEHYFTLYHHTLLCACEGGHQDLIAKLLSITQPVFADIAMQAAAKAGHVDIVNWLIKSFPERTQPYLLDAASNSHFPALLHPYFLRFTAFLDLDQIGTRPIIESSKYTPAVLFEITDITNQAKQLRNVMRLHQFNFRQAEAASQYELRIFFLEVMPYIRDHIKNFPLKDISLKIATYIADMPQNDMMWFYKKFWLVVVSHLKQNHPKMCANFTRLFSEPDTSTHCVLSRDEFRIEI
jgi:hypothetical protein